MHALSFSLWECFNDAAPLQSAKSLGLGVGEVSLYLFVIIREKGKLIDRIAKYPLIVTYIGIGSPPPIHDFYQVKRSI